VWELACACPGTQLDDVPRIQRGSFVTSHAPNVGDSRAIRVDWKDLIRPDTGQNENPEERDRFFTINTVQFIDITPQISESIDRQVNSYIMFVDLVSNAVEDDITRQYLA
jgi:hypothetical protein